MNPGLCAALVLACVLAATVTGCRARPARPPAAPPAPGAARPLAPPTVAPPAPPAPQDPPPAPAPEVQELLEPRLEELAARVRDGNDEVRAAAAEELARIGAPARATLEALAAAPGLEVRAQTARALGLAQLPGTNPLLRSLLHDASWAVRARAAEALGRMKDPADLPDLVTAVADPEWRVRIAAAAALAGLGNPAGAAALERLAADPDPDLHFAAVEALARVPGPAAAAVLRRELASEDVELVAVSLRGLSDRKDTAAVPEMTHLVSAGPLERRILALHALVQFPPPLPAPAQAFVRELVALLGDAEQGSTAWQALREIGPVALDALHEGLRPASAPARQSILTLLRMQADPASREPLLACYEAAPGEARAPVLECLAAIGATGLEVQFGEAAASADPTLQAAGFAGLAACGSGAARDLLLRFLSDPIGERRACAARTLARFRASAELRPRVLERLREESDTAAFTAVLSLLPPPPDVEVTAALLARLKTETEPERRGHLVVTLGQYRGEGVPSALIGVLREDDPARAALALGALATDPDPGLVPLFLTAWREAKTPELRGAALRAAARADTPEVRAAVRAGLTAPERAVQDAALAAATRLKDEEALVGLARRAGTSEIVRFQAMEALGRAAGPEARRYLLDVARGDASETCRSAAIRALAYGQDKDLLPQLLEATAAEKSPHVRQALALALGLFQDPRALAALTAMAADPEEWVRGNAAMALGLVRDPGAVAPLVALLDDAKAPVRQAATAALIELDPPSARKPLFARLADAEPSVRLQALTYFGREPDPAMVPHLLKVAEQLTGRDRGISPGVTTADYLFERGLTRLARPAYAQALAEVTGTPATDRFVARRVHERLARLELEECRFAAASGHFRSALEAARAGVGGETPADELEAWVRIAGGLDKLRDGRTRTGIEDLDAGIRLGGAKPALLLDTALRLADRGLALDRALVYAQRALELVPKDAWGLEVVGLVKLRRGETGPALADLRQACATAADDRLQPTLHYNLAAGLALAGDPEAALKELQWACGRDSRLCTQARTDPDFARLARDARFREVVRPLEQPDPLR